MKGGYTIISTTKQRIGRLTSTPYQLKKNVIMSHFRLGKQTFFRLIGGYVVNSAASFFSMLTLLCQDIG